MSNNPKCPVFGCTIPRGIPHEHPAGTYMVMRDPVAPMSRHERAHIKALSDALQHGTGFTLDGKYVPHSDVYVVPADAPMVPGRKLTQALLDAGRLHREGHNDLAFYDESKAKWQDNPVTIDQAPAPRRSFVSLTARVAFWIVLAVTVCIWIFAGVKS